jgi:hypothetical protein
VFPCPFLGFLKRAETFGGAGLGKAARTKLARHALQFDKAFPTRRLGFTQNAHGDGRFHLNKDNSQPSFVKRANGHYRKGAKRETEIKFIL